MEQKKLFPEDAVDPKDEAPETDVDKAPEALESELPRERDVVDFDDVEDEFGRDDDEDDDYDEDNEDDEDDEDEDEEDDDEGGFYDEDDEGEFAGEPSIEGFPSTTRDIEVAPSTLVRRVPSPRRSMMVGAVLGGAIGDAMGHPTEFIGSIQSIRQRYGSAGVTGFTLYWERGGKRFAPYTDDTQMAEVVLRTLIESRLEDMGLDATMKRMAQGFIEWSERPQGGHRAPGNACMSGCRALARGVHWSTAGGERAGGCGSVMRAYPFGLVFSDDLKRAERWSVAHSKLTHRDPIALAACAAMAVGTARILQGDSVMTVATEMVAAACRYSTTTAGMMTRAIDDALSNVAPEVTMDRLRAWAAHEAIAAGVYLFVRNPDDPVKAILEGANTPGDSDSIATIGGALVGARCGVEALPQEWVKDVERTEELTRLAERAAVAT